MAKAVPEGLRTATAHLCVSPCSEAIAFYEKAFAAKTPEGKEFKSLELHYTRS